MPEELRTGVVELSFPVELLYRKRTKLWVIGIPILDLWTQGSHKQEAWENLWEAVSIFFEECAESEHLPEVLEKCGFTLGAPTFASPPKKSAEPGKHFGVSLPLRVSPSRRRVPCPA